MKKIGNFQMLGASITTIGIMFLIISCLACLNVIPVTGAGFDTAIVSLLMATNGYMIALLGIFNDRSTAGVTLAAHN